MDETISVYLGILLPPLLSAFLALVTNYLSTRNPQQIIAAGINNRKTPYLFRLRMQAKMHLPVSRYFSLLL